MNPTTPTWHTFLAAWELFRDPLLCAIAAGTVLGFLGVYVVLRRMVFVSAAVTQSSALGVALAFFAEIHLGFKIDPVVGAFVFAILSTLLLSVDARSLRLPRESLLGFAFAFTGGATILVEDKISQEAHDIHSILFGSAVLVRFEDLVVVAVTGGVVLLLHVLWYRGLVFASFDPDAARVQGLPVRFLNSFLLGSVGVTVGVSARALGALPVFALATLPAVAVLALGLELAWGFALAALLGAVSGGLGYLIAFFYELPVGGSQTMVASGIAVAALAGHAVTSAVRRRLGR
jgi:zinc transport system permease protein